MCQRTECDIVHQILGYFLRYPEAADSLEGITEWRLADERIHRAVEETKVALDWLVSKGFLAEELAATTPVYRLNGEVRERAAKFLSESSG